MQLSCRADCTGYSGRAGYISCKTNVYVLCTPRDDRVLTRHMNQVSPRKVSDSLFASLAIIRFAEELAHQKESGSPVGNPSASRWRSRLRSERLSVNKIAITTQTDQRGPWNNCSCYPSSHHSIDDNPRPRGSYRQILRSYCNHCDGEPGLFLGHWKFCGAFHQ